MNRIDLSPLCDPTWYVDSNQATQRVHALAVQGRRHLVAMCRWAALAVEQADGDEPEMPENGRRALEPILGDAEGVATTVGAILGFVEERRQACEECEGAGVVECPTCGLCTMPCPECEGRLVRLGPAVVSAHRLERFLRPASKSSPACESCLVSAPAANSAVRIFGGGWRAVIMPLRHECLSEAELAAAAVFPALAPPGAAPQPQAAKQEGA